MNERKSKEESRRYLLLGVERRQRDLRYGGGHYPIHGVDDLRRICRGGARAVIKAACAAPCGVILVGLAEVRK